MISPGGSTLPISGNLFEHMAAVDCCKTGYCLNPNFSSAIIPNINANSSRNITYINGYPPMVNISMNQSIFTPPQNVSGGSNRNQLHQDSLRNILDIFANDDYSSHRKPWVSNMLIGLYTLMSSLGLLFNLILVVAMLWSKSLNNVTNIFVLMLAFSDIVLCSFNVPLQTYYDVSENTGIGTTAMCRILFTSFGLPLYVSCLTILLIAIDRHQMIVYPLRQRMSSRMALLLIGAVIIFSVINSIPVALYTRSDKVIGSQGNQYCVENWPSRISRLIYSVAIFAIHFLCPLLITAVLYLRIYIRLSQRLFKKKDEEHKKRTNKILMSVVACFAVCWTPWCIYSLLLEVQAYIQKPDSTYPPKIVRVGNTTVDCNRLEAAAFNMIPAIHLKLIDLLLKLFAMSSACVNPFLYGWLNEPIRQAMQKLYRFLVQQGLKLTGGGRNNLRNQANNNNNNNNTNTKNNRNRNHESDARTFVTTLVGADNDLHCDCNDATEATNNMIPLITRRSDNIGAGSCIKVDVHENEIEREQLINNITNNSQVIIYSPPDDLQQIHHHSADIEVDDQDINLQAHQSSSPGGRILIVAYSNNVHRDGELV